MARMSAQEAAEVAQALARQSSQKTDNGLPPASGPGGIPGGIFRGKATEGSGTGQTLAGLASAYVETGRTLYDSTTDTTPYFTHDGLFRIGIVPIKTLTIAESNSSGNPTGSPVTITFKQGA
ncbi:hypothetical protein [Paludibacterium denitrificans]|uniref:Uncharacterized protein n=1 Tax=Paludibacterium denitrificans TaxID=2675226 RepID=A0A844GGP2_9NEIS|nr:hypothetical protein [Paludibacterium denitrificans]MTD33675.1 hypothetical protein [Paludibacterium denitrificans]